MPFGYMDLPDIARLLGIDVRRAERMARRGDIPCQKVQGHLRFNRAEITEWLQQQVGTMNNDKLSQMEVGISSHRDVNPEDIVVSNLVTIPTTSANLGARTRNSVIKELVALAQESGSVYDPETLLETVLRREELCSTAMEGGIAIPHPRRPLPYAIAEPILVVAKTSQGIGFGAPDGRLTDLFFLTCSRDDRYHLHVLARLCRMLQHKQLLLDLREAETAEEMVQIIRKWEKVVTSEAL